MNPALTPATLFWAQLALWICYVPASYAAYRWSRVPMRKARDQRAICRLDGERSPRSSEEDTHNHRLANFLWPLLVAMTIPTLVMLVYHPYVRDTNTSLLDWVWPNFLAQGSPQEGRAAIARFAFWGFGGAFLYSFTMIWRRYMAMDVTPNTYTYAGIRFLTSMFIGCTVGALLGAARAAGGRAVSEFQLRYFEIWRPLRNAVVCGTVLHSLMHGEADEIDPVTIALSTFTRLQADLARSLDAVMRG